MSDRIVLEIVGPYGEDGWEDEDGNQFYNSTTVAKPFGVVGNLKVHDDAGETVIDQAPEVILVSHNLTEDVYRDAFETKWLDVIGRNGHVRYQLLDDEVVWWDAPDEVIPHHLSLLSFSEWTPESEFVEEPKRETITEVLQEAE